VNGGTGTIGFDMSRTDGFAQHGDHNIPIDQLQHQTGVSNDPTYSKHNHLNINSAKARPVSAYASSSPQNHPSSGHNPVDSFNGQQMHPTIQPGGKIRPHSGVATGRSNPLNLTAPVMTGTPVPPKVFNNYSRTSQYNTGELNLDKVVKKISRKQKLSRTDSWAPQDIQDLLNG
jgi:hypothetical protein